MTDTCPVCGRERHEYAVLRDGGSLVYELHHLRCVRAMQAERDRYRDLFKRANAAKRREHARSCFWHSELDAERVFTSLGCTVYRNVDPETIEREMTTSATCGRTELDA